MISYPFDFQKIYGKFRKRLNRFIVSAIVDNKEVLAYLPNTGRLLELLVKDTPLILVKNKEKLKTPYTVIACYKEDNPILLHTHLTNEIIANLISEKRISYFVGSHIIQKEVSYGNSRFDFLLRDETKSTYLEVKTCTLFLKDIAMFPDAITERGTRHLLHLKEISTDSPKQKGGILFVIMNPDIKYFMAAYHIDKRFSETLFSVKNFVDIRAISLKWDINFSFVEEVKEVNILWDFPKK